VRGALHEGRAGLTATRDEWLERWREYFIAWYDEGGVEEKAKEAAELASRYLDEGVVSVSGGKDSMTLLHIVVSRCRPDVAVFHWDHGPWLVPREVEREVLENIRLTAPRAELIVEEYELGRSERSRNEWRSWYRAFFSTLKGLGFKHHLLGVRGEEGWRRRARGRVVDRGRWI